MAQAGEADEALLVFGDVSYGVLAFPALESMFFEARFNGFDLR